MEGQGEEEDGGGGEKSSSVLAGTDAAVCQGRMFATIFSDVDYASSSRAYGGHTRSYGKLWTV